MVLGAIVMERKGDGIGALKEARRVGAGSGHGSATGGIPFLASTVPPEFWSVEAEARSSCIASMMLPSARFNIMETVREWRD
jgi:hypothetical protein